MNLYKISQDENDGYDNYDSAVVAAESEEEAIKIHPGSGRLYPDWDSENWVNDLDLVSVKLIGTAVEGTKPGVILASYNAG